MEHSPFEFLLNLSLTPVNKQQELPRWQNFACMLAKIIATVSSPPLPRLDAVLKVILQLLNSLYQLALF